MSLAPNNLICELSFNCEVVLGVDEITSICVDSIPILVQLVLIEIDRCKSYANTITHMIELLMIALILSRSFALFFISLKSNCASIQNKI